MNKNRSSKSRHKSSSIAPQQIVNFFSNPLSPPNNDRGASTSPSTDRKRKLSERGESSCQDEDTSSYQQAIQEDAAKISKIRKSKKVATMVSAFFQRNNVVDDLSDFQSPQKKIQFKDPPVMPKTKAARKRKLPAKKSKTKTESDTDIFEKVLFHHSNADGLNSDDLQMALALSRSLADTHGTNCEGPNSSITEAIRSAEPNDKEDVIRQTFKQFGFKKSDNNEYDYRDFFENATKRKWSKFTPLTRRSDSIQKQKFANRVKRMLRTSEVLQNVASESIQEYSVTSSYLHQFFVSQSPSYNINVSTTEATVADFYVNNLVPISTLRCGCLLKNWADIPGRDLSPQRKKDIESTPEVHNDIKSDDLKTNEQEPSAVESNVANSQEVCEIAQNIKEVSSHETCQLADEKSEDSHMDITGLPSTAVSVDIDPRNERELSPDMFADYESSANNSLNDDDVAMSVDPTADSRISNGKTSADSCPAALCVNEMEMGYDATESLTECKVSGEKSPTRPITLSSDGSNQAACDNNLSRSKSNGFPLTSHLSFTDRLQLYNSDPALGATADDNGILSQDSVVISDDEINYSINRRDDSHSSTSKLCAMLSQESIVLSDSDDEVDERQASFASIEIDNRNDYGSNMMTNSLNDQDLLNLEVEELCQKNDFMSGSGLSQLITMSQDSILLSDSEDEIKRLVQDDVEERQSFASIENNSPNQKSCELDLGIDDDIFNSNQSLNDEELINISVHEMCRKEFVAGASEPSSTFSRTTSDLTFERKTGKPSQTPNECNNSSDDEFDRLVRGNKFRSPIPNGHSIEISDDEFDKSFESRRETIRSENNSPVSPAAECNEFIVQSMDQLYEVRTGKLVSPKPDYENMDSPTRLVHLKKYGLKMLSKRKAVICLEHIYNRLHPFIELDETDELDIILDQKETHAIDSDKKRIDGVATIHQPAANTINHFDGLQESEEVFYLPSAPRSKKPWCLQPLHIAWHNLINSNTKLYDDILVYRPIDLMEIRSMFKSVDLRFEMNDIISFLDRKCITFKTDSKRNKAVPNK